MRKVMLLAAALGAVGAGAIVAWRRNPRLGSGLVNERVNPFLLQRGLSGGQRAEIGTLEHFGRRTGTRRVTPVHPEPIDDGFRILVPLGLQSEWARNVLAAGHCRLQLHATLFELDEPALLQPREMADVPFVARAMFGALGFAYLRLHRFAERPGSLDDATMAAAGNTSEAAGQAPVTPEPEAAGVA